MALLVTIQSLNSHFYEEIADEISRSDDSILQEGIDSAIDEAKSYLNRFDLPQLFGTAVADATVSSSKLMRVVKDIVKWNLIGLIAPNIDYADAETRYNAALVWLKDVQAGKATPENWPYKDLSGATEPPAGRRVTWNSNPKRNNHL